MSSVISSFLPASPVQGSDSSHHSKKFTLVPSSEEDNSIIIPPNLDQASSILTYDASGSIGNASTNLDISVGASALSSGDAGGGDWSA